MRQWGQFFFQEQEENLFLDSKIAHTQPHSPQQLDT